MSTDPEQPTMLERLEAIRDRYKKILSRRKTIKHAKLKLARRMGWATIHHPCAKHGTASKNTNRNPLNVRASKGMRRSGIHAKHYAFKHRYNLS
jgi:hypothetical protein